MTSRELRQKYLDFFKSKGHTIISSASLIPENDPTVLFTTAGMHPLVPYLMGEKHPGGKRVANAQKCIRTGDIDEVGDATHHTFFEMLGNWSLGDYFKKEAIEMSWEFLTSPDWLGLDKNRLAVSVFKGDEDAPFDQEAFNIWKSLGVPEQRIARLPKKNNWWGPAGETGPCGPDTEMFYWVGKADQVPAAFNDDNSLWVEIWNDVFMQYNKTKAGAFEPLKQKNVDTGMGLERTLAIINGFDDNYRTELFWPIIEKTEQLSRNVFKHTNYKYSEDEEITKYFRIIADHIKAAVFIISDGIKPSNTERGYVLRRLIRRVIRYSWLLGIQDNSFTWLLAQDVINIYKDVYADLLKNETLIYGVLKTEESNFRMKLENGIIESNKIKVVNGQNAFYLYQTFGFPIEMIIEDFKNRKLNFDEKKLMEEFNIELKKHQDLSRTASAGMFKGGLADSGEETKKLHTAAHLLLAALRKTLGEHVIQKGSNITAERLRFDFSHPDKLTEEQKKTMEAMVNEVIRQDLPVTCEEMSLNDAKAKGAHGIFESKYGEKVKVYTVGNSSAGSKPPFSREICGGPHAGRTGELGHFKIQKEESSSSGVRRIKAVLE